jgi:hypothetical protein
MEVRISEHAKTRELLTRLIVPRGGLFANPRKAWPTHPFGGPVLQLSRGERLGAPPETRYGP